MSFETIVISVVLLLVVAAVFPPARRFFRSVGNWIGGQADKVAETVAGADPLAVYRSQVASAAEAGKNASKVVESAARQLVSLQQQIDSDLKEQTRLTNRITAVLASGDPNHTAESYALQLERVEHNLEVNKGQLDSAQTTYDENLKLVEQYETEVVNARKDAEALGFQLQSSQAEKDLRQMSVGLHDKLNLGDLATARRRVQEKIDANRGASKAAADLGRHSTAEQADEDLERKARASAVLDRFKAKQNVLIGGVRSQD